MKNFAYLWSFSCQEESEYTIHQRDQTSAAEYIKRLASKKAEANKVAIDRLSVITVTLQDVVGLTLMVAIDLNVYPIH